MEEIKPEMFKDGMTKEEKAGLANDLKAIQHFIQTHDQSLFQVIGVLNAIQDVLIQKGLIAEVDLEKAIQDSFQKLEQVFQEKLNDKA